MEACVNKYINTIRLRDDIIWSEVYERLKEGRLECPAYSRTPLYEYAEMNLESNMHTMDFLLLPREVRNPILQTQEGEDKAVCLFLRQLAEDELRTLKNITEQVLDRYERDEPLE